MRVASMGLSLQSGTEFLTTYGFVILIIVIGIALLVAFNKVTSIVPSSCSIYGTLNCADVAYGTNSIGVTTLVILASSQVQGTINVSSFNAVVAGVNSISGSCKSAATGATVVHQGDSMYCTATFPSKVVLTQTYSGTFNITGSYCGSGSASCSSKGGKYTFGGASTPMQRPYR